MHLSSNDNNRLLILQVFWLIHLLILFEQINSELDSYLLDFLI